MNERIKELADQSYHGYGLFNSNEPTQLTRQANKFAKLLLLNLANDLLTTSHGTINPAYVDTVLKQYGVKLEMLEMLSEG